MYLNITLDDSCFTWLSAISSFWLLLTLYLDLLAMLVLKYQTFFEKFAEVGSGFDC